MQCSSGRADSFIDVLRAASGYSGNTPAGTRIFHHNRIECVIDDANLVLQTTLNGQGVALGILPFVEEDLLTGKLIRPFDHSIDPDLSYYLIYRKKDLEKPAVESV
jgi:DNA-binding transcriptional LysR family regulator